MWPNSICTSAPHMYIHTCSGMCSAHGRRSICQSSMVVNHFLFYYFFFLLSCQGDACGRRWCWAIAHCNVMSLLVFLLLLTTALRISFTLPIKSFIGIVATREWRVASTSSHSIYSPASSSIVHMCCACANGQFIHTVRFAYTCSWLKHTVMYANSLATSVQSALSVCNCAARAFTSRMLVRVARAGNLSLTPHTVWQYAFRRCIIILL